MAPTKDKAGQAEKAEKLTPAQSADLMLHYLRAQNRPYSATDISANLKNRVTKTLAAKVLKEMHEKKLIEGKAAGKQVVYHALQDPSDTATPEDLAAMNVEIARLHESTVDFKSEERKLRAAIRDGGTVVPIAEIKSAISGLQVEATELEKRLEVLRSGEVKPVDPAERAKVDAEWRTWQVKEKARKKIAKDLWATVRDMMPEGTNAEEVKEALDVTV